MVRRAVWMVFAVLATHLCLLVRGAPHIAAAAAAAACSLALAGCLWFVAARQIGPVPGLLALALYVLSPPAWHPDAATATALVIFVFLATAVGVGHALQGPPRKWFPRFTLLGLLAAAGAVLEPRACFAALFPASVALLYLTVRRRAWVAPIVLGAAAIAALGAHLRPLFISNFPAFFALAGPGSRPGQWSGILLALIPALGLWALSSRSRFFGNTAPLVAAAVFALLSLLPVGRAAAFAWSCALPPALLFVAGVFADGIDSRRRRAWQTMAWVACLLQAALFLLTS